MNKTRYLGIILGICAIVSGCTLEEVTVWGMRCPPDGLENADEIPLSFIGNANCTAEDMSGCDPALMASKDLSLYFKTKNCPQEYRVCAAHRRIDGEYGYHCEEDDKSICVQGIACTDENGDKFCLDPSRTMTCGATNCFAEAPTYGGQDCSKLHAKCEEVAQGVFGCVSQETGELVCGEDYIDPSDEQFCGASDCNLENYGGTDCSIYGDDSICSKDRETHQYQCQCRKNTILCGDTCIRPKYDDEYCGARGNCTETDSASGDYIGENCLKGDGFCKNEACQCAGDEIWCVIEGMNDDKPRCYSPSNNETCGAKLSEDGIHCDIRACTGHYQCLNVSRYEYKCNLAECDEGELLCYMDDGNRECFAKNDVHHCGNCSKDCSLHNYENAEAKACGAKDGNAVCTYECKAGYTNCGDEYSPICVNVKSSSQHCGGCGKACQGNSYCQDGACQLTECASNECTTLTTDNTKICVNWPDRCGKDCRDCREIQADGKCVDGQCVVGGCSSGTHPVYDTKGQITNCVKNSNESCAPSNMKPGGTPVNCAQKLSEHVKSAACSADGACYIQECDAGYRIDSTKTKCVANSVTECGAAGAAATRNCKAIEHVDSVTCNSDGSCTVNSCQSGFHPNKGRTACDATTEYSCASTQSNSAINCVGSNVKKASCNNGQCSVSECTSNQYHLNSSKTGCEANTDTACGTAKSVGVNCTTRSFGRVCKTSEGVCACSRDDSTVVNYDGNACVPKICKGVPGVLTGESTDYNYMGQAETGACRPTSCVSGYKLENISRNAVCHPTSSALCSNLGYLNTAISGEGWCRACSTGGTCNAAQCVSTHKFFMASCLPADACCGSRNYSSDRFYTCTNCLAINKKCNTSSGYCE